MLRERVARPQHPRECDVGWRRSDGLLLPENERDPSVLDRIHSDAPAWRFARRSSLATDGQWRPGAWHTSATFLMAILGLVVHMTVGQRRDGGPGVGIGRRRTKLLAERS